MGTTVYSLEFLPLVPVPVLFLLGIASAACILPLILKRTNGSWLRATIATLFCLLLANPALQQEKRESQSDIALIVVDKSPSQRIGQRPDISAEVLDDLTTYVDQQDGLDYRIVRTDGAGTSHDGTHLLPAMIRAQAAISPRRLAGTFILSDGQLHDRLLQEQQTQGLLQSIHPDSPIHLLKIGAPHEADRRIVVDQAPRFTIIGENAPITFTIEDTNTDGPQQEQVNAKVLIDGKPYGTYGMTPGVPVTISPEIQHGGQTIVEIETPVLDEGELTDQNNRTVVTINGIRQRLKVLLVTGEPHLGERTWRNLLKSDPSVELVHFTILRPPEKQDGTPSMELALIAFPTRELFVEKLKDFDLIIFDRYKLRGVLPLNYFQNIAQYVREGGALLVAAGPAFSSSLSVYRTPLGRILPGRPSGSVLAEAFRPGLTDPGHIHPVTAALTQTQTENWGRWFRMIDTEPVAGEILMDGLDGAPLLIVSRVGEGRVAQLNSDQAWLWTRGFEGGGPQTELLRRTAHWLMKEPELEEESLSLSVSDNTLHAELTTMLDQPPHLLAVKPDGQTTELVLRPAGPDRPGKWVAEMAADLPGIYRVAAGPRIAVTSKGSANPVEYANLLPTRDILAPLLEATGGGAFDITPHGTVSLPTMRQYSGETQQFAGPDWAALKRNQSYRVTGYRKVPLTPVLLTLLLLLGGLLLGWYRESR